jgi:prevent-host-death family protein
MPSAIRKQATSSQATQEVSVAQAKAHFSSVLDSVEKRRRPITILKRGRAIAQIIPMQQEAPALYGSMRGTVVELGDIVGPIGEEWTIGDE